MRSTRTIRVDPASRRVNDYAIKQTTSRIYCIMITIRRYSLHLLIYVYSSVVVQADLHQQPSFEVASPRRIQVWTTVGIARSNLVDLSLLVVSI
jgi:hypothetical protein